MADSKFTSILGDLLVGVKDMHDWGVNKGHVDEKKLRLTVQARQAEAKKLVDAGMSKRKAAKLLGVGESTIREDLRGNRAKSARKSRTRKTATKPKGLRGPVREDDLMQQHCADCETPQAQWQDSVAQAAGDAIAMRSYWTRAFDEEWEKFEVTSDLVKLAKQASEEWSDLANQLSRRLKDEKKAA